MSTDGMKRGVRDTTAGGVPDADDFDMHTTLVPAQVVFESQKRWAKLSAEDIRDLRAQPLTTLADVFQRFAPEAKFEMTAEQRDTLLGQLGEAGVSVAAEPGALADWAIRGKLRGMRDFSPAGVTEGGEQWSTNILAELGQVDGLLAGAARAGTEIDFENRDEFLEDLDAVLALLSTHTAGEKKQ
jgi:hypothetical protein